ncbi:MAG: hypothetical protein ACQR33_05730 [Candidatus Saccharibacteria bacterium]
MSEITSDRNGIDRSRYTEPELVTLAESGRLPGFLESATYDPELFDGTAWQPVLNVAFTHISPMGAEPMSRQAQLHVLTAIRKRETNETHADVVSTPTRRMTTASILGIIASKAPYCNTPQGQSFKLTEVDPAQPQVIATFDPARVGTRFG